MVAQHFAFQNPPKALTFAKPKAVRLGAASYEVGSWAKLLVTVARAVLLDVRYRRNALDALAKNGAAGERTELRRPMELEKGLWLEGNLSATDIIWRARQLLVACGYPLESAVVEYAAIPHGDSIPRKKTPAPTPPRDVNRGSGETFRFRNGEKAGTFARRMFAKALAEGHVPRDDFFACLDDKVGTKRVFGLHPGGHPLFSRQLMKDGKNLRSWSRPFPTRFGFPVYVNSQWRTEHLDKLSALFGKWKVKNAGSNIFLSTPLQPSLFDTSTSQPESLIRETGRHRSSVSRSTPMGPKPERFETDIRNNWPEGFDFSDGAVRLLEGRCGKLPKGMKGVLKSRMFHPRGRVWLLPETVASEKTRNAVAATAGHFVREWGLVATRVLVPILDGPGTKLRNPQEREAFATFLARQAGLSICELEGDNYVSSRGDASTEETAQTLCSMVREFISGRGGVIRAETILEEFGNLDEQSLSNLMARWEPDAIPERDGDGSLSFKMLAEFYLPEDFGDALKDALARADAEGTVPTSAWLANFLSERYACDFVQDYALNPSGTLKWAIKAVWNESTPDDKRRWEGEGAHAMFVTEKPGGRASFHARDLSSRVEAEFPGVFTNEEFWRYTVGNCGLSGTKEAKIAQLGYIAPGFVRLDRDHWMSVAAFCRASGWNAAMAESMAEVLRKALGTSAMLPVASLGASVTDALPEVAFRENGGARNVRWTPELVASVAALLCPGVHVANHGVTPFALSALLVPKPVANKDVFAYAMRLYCARNPHHRDVKGAFAFLQANNVRFRFTGRTRREIEDYLAGEAR